VKLQQAYFSESGKIGTWSLIGYKAPGSNTSNQGVTTNFTYSSSMTGATTDEQTAASGKAWKANNKNALNDCPSGDNWKMGVKADVANSASGGDITFNATVDSKCAGLTPTFDTIGD
jgi:hypothetical protein